MFLKNNLFTILLVIVSSIIFISSITKIPHITGDGHEYYMMAESFVNHGTFDQRTEDGNYPRGYFQSLNGKYYSYHFWAYSLLTVPAKLICNLLEIDDLQSFQLTNALLFILMIWLLYFKLKLPEQQKNALILLLIFNPILYYLDWTHTEVFTYVFAVLALMYYVNRSYKTSYALMAIASWQNPPVIFFSLLVFIVQSFHYFKQKSYKKIILEGISLSLFLVPMLFYFYNYRVLNLIAAKGFSSIHYISWDKIWDLYFGLQHGMILFSAAVLIAFFFVTIQTFRQKRFTTTNIILLLSIVSISIVVTTAPNWNCGMEFIIRYATWIYAFIVYYVVLNMGDTLKLKVVTVANTLFFIIIFFTYTNFSPIKFNELSKFVLTNFPSYYITSNDTFAENVLNKEIDWGGEDQIIYNNYPIIFKDSDGNYNKILTNYQGLKKLINDPQVFIRKSYAEKLLEKYKNMDKLFYINTAKGDIYQKYYYFTGADLPSVIGLTKDGSKTVSGKKTGFLTFGPYITLSSGKYKFKIKYKSREVNSTQVGTWDVSIHINKENKIIEKGILVGTNSKESYITKTFILPREYSNKKIEIRNYYNGTGDLAIKSLTITKVE